MCRILYYLNSYTYVYTYRVKDVFLNNLETHFPGSKETLVDDALIGCLSANKLPAIDVLGSCLQIERPKIEQIKNVNQYSIGNQALEMLNCWKKMNGHKATIGKLIQA